MNGIGVSEQQPRAPGGGGQLTAREGFAGPTLWQGQALKQPDPGIKGSFLLNNASCPVAGVVIEHQDFVAGIVLATEGIEASADIGSLVSGWNQDGQKGKRVGKFGFFVTQLVQRPEIHYQVDQEDHQTAGYYDEVDVPHHRVS